MVLILLAGSGIAGLHHHSDGHDHSDCTLCLFLIQPVVAEAPQEPVGVLSPFPEDPLPLLVSVPFLCFRTVQPSRAPPCRCV
ncbi:hypothetical protein [Syntrophorhabdus aromaticivorans]|uniref:hypothetical protein n=1 Tax=Syntrophorhabdus aromaticivorans TaxID=328301 RepID=UPI003BFA2B2C